MWTAGKGNKTVYQENKIVCQEHGRRGRGVPGSQGGYTGRFPLPLYALGRPPPGRPLGRPGGGRPSGGHRL